MIITGEDCKPLLQNKSIDWESPFVHSTSELKPRVWATFYGMNFVGYGKNKIKISGSIHHFWNLIQGGEKQNWNRFSRADLNKAIHLFSQLLGLNPERFRLETLEYGLNIENPPFDISKTLDWFFYLFSRRFNEYESGLGKVAKVGTYLIKGYHKGKQANIPREILRLELKAFKMVFFQSRKIEIATLADLLRPESIEILHQELISRLREATIHEPNLSTRKMSTEERAFWKHAGNPNHWKQFSRQELSGARNFHQQIKNKYCKTSTNELIIQLLNDEFALLSGTKAKDSKKSYRVSANRKEKNHTKFEGQTIEKSYRVDDRYDYTIPPRPDDPRAPLNGTRPDDPPRACVRCENPIVGRSSSARYCCDQCKRQFEANHKRVTRWQLKHGRAGGRLFDQT